MNARGLALSARSAFWVLLAAGAATDASAQVSGAGEVVRLELSSGSSVVVVPVLEDGAQSEEAVAYEYLPSALRLARGDDGEPQILFAAGSDQADGSGSGVGPTRNDLAHGVLHVVLDWTLDETEIERAELEIKARCGDVLGRFLSVIEPMIPLASGRGAAWVRPLRGPPIEPDRIPCGDIRGPASIYTPEPGTGTRLYFGPGYDDPDARVSQGRVVLLPDQRLAVAFELDSIASAWLAQSLGRLGTPAGAWWLELDLASRADDMLAAADEGAGYELTSSYDIRPWFQSLRRRVIRFVLGSGIDPSDFETVLDHVVVMLSKRHKDGTVTRKAFVLDSANGGEATYGWSGDEDRDRWLTYQYRHHWSFRDGGSYDTGWIEADDSLVDLYVPYQQRTVRLEADPATLDELRERGVREIVVELSHPFFAIERTHRKTVRLDRPFRGETIGLVLPRGQFEYDYQINWHFVGRDGLTAVGTESSPLIFIDELPTREEDE